MTNSQVTALAAVLGAIVATTLIYMGWQSDMAWLPQVMLLVGGYFAQAVKQLIKEI